MWPRLCDRGITSEDDLRYLGGDTARAVLLGEPPAVRSRFAWFARTVKDEARARGAPTAFWSLEMFAPL